MKQLKNYLFKTYSGTFFPIFLILFIITSIIFLVQIARLTSIIEINFIELLLLYSFTIPKILFYILPISIFISLTLTIAKLSNDYELTVITSFGLNPLKLLKLLLPHLVLVTLLLFAISLILIPKTRYLNVEFMEKKKSEAQFNINPSEFGQKFGDWFIYVNDKKENSYKNIVLFKTDSKQTDLIIANKAFASPNINNNLSLNLLEGKAFNIEESFKQIDFKTMIINNKIESGSLINTFDDILSYWKGIKNFEPVRSKFIFNILYSFLPLLSILFSISIGYFNPRYEKNKSSVFVLVLTTAYVVAIQKVSNNYGLGSLLAMPAVWIGLSYSYYRLRIKSYY